MPRLTKRLVDSLLEAKDFSDTVVWDDDLPGFGLRLRSGGSASYVAVYRQAGRRRWFTIGSHGAPWSPDEARKAAAGVLMGAATGGDPQKTRSDERKKTATVDDLIDAYLRDGPVDKPNKKPGTWVQDRSSLKRHISPLIGTHRLTTLTKAEMATLQAKIASGHTSAVEKTKKRGLARVRGGKAIAARTMIIWQATLEWGVKRGYLEANPCKGVPRFKIDARERYLLKEELERLWKALDTLTAIGTVAPAHALIFRLLALTGARKSEIVQLRWREVDLTRRLIFLSSDRSKTGAKTIPLGVLAAEMLARWKEKFPRARQDDFVFPPLRSGASSTVGVQKSWERLRRAADLPDVRLHDLRHTFASIAVADGASLYVVGRVLGHTQSRTTERYAHLAAAPAQAVADQVAGKLGVAPTPPRHEAPKPAGARASAPRLRSSGLTGAPRNASPAILRRRRRIIIRNLPLPQTADAPQGPEAT